MSDTSMMPDDSSSCVRKLGAFGRLEDEAEPTMGSDRERAPRPGYYYDDGTGYELYNPDEDEEDRKEDDQENAEEKR